MEPILIIDDEKDNLDALHRLLRSEYEVNATTSPFEGLKQIRSQEFSVIISDQRMPEMSGVDLLEKAKQLSPVTTRILLTGYTDINAIISSINRGNIYRYIAKPWDPQELKLTIKQAAEAFNLRKEIEEKNKKLEQNNADLKLAFEQLSLLDKAKDRFLSLISHELNTPLTVLTSFMDLLSQQKEQIPKDVLGAVKSMSLATARFSEIISEVLLFVKLEAEHRYEKVPFDLLEELQTLKNEVDSLTKRKNISLVINHSSNTKFACDPEKIRVALHRLLKDTIERSPEGEEIRVGIEVSDRGANLSVWRAGEPLPSDAFEPLETGKNPMHHQQGLGLSLALCKLIVEGHGGRVTQKAAANKGVLVTIHLP